MGKEKTAVYGFFIAVALVVVVGLALASVAVRSARQGRISPVLTTTPQPAAAATDGSDDSSTDPSKNLDPAKGPTAWGYEVAKIMSRALPENDGALITAGELLSLGPMLAVGERVPWDRLKDANIVAVEIGGTDLLAAVGSAVKYYPRKNSSFLQMFGLRALCSPGEKTTQLTTLGVGDKAVAPGGTYRLVVTEFMAKGGGPFLGLKSVQLVSEPVSLLAELRKRLFPLGEVPEPEPTYLFSNKKG